ncbi:DUF6273 domain-containing protein [Butyrivibrio sp. LC3010]|uniref:DUF6273 domain-containing protein n=1 Tax=Butyrivibrio sp. LC3010 TaxID=1280680 RepID=UPI00040864B5|nr:DUF6273 domain-containing protein [Butyrivibrio sp. LC3010]
MAKKNKIMFALMNVLIQGKAVSIQNALSKLDSDSYELKEFSYHPDKVDEKDNTIVKTGVVFNTLFEDFISPEDIPFANMPEIKFIGLGNGGDGSRSDGTYVFFKDYGDIGISDYFKFSNVNPQMEEFEGQWDVLEKVHNSFMDREWQYKYEDYSCGEYCPWEFKGEKARELINKWESLEKDNFSAVPLSREATSKSASKPKKTNEIKIDSLKSLSIGDSFYFGRYPQKSKNKLEPIEWIILEKNSSAILLISKYVLDNQPFHECKKSTPWGESLIREWLENTFIPKAFDEEEQKFIVPTKIVEPDNVGTKYTSQDRVFLLSEKEVKKYLADSEYKTTIGTRYADNCHWGLRSYKKGAESFQYCTSMSGRIMSNKFGDESESFHHNYNCTLGVRPAMWIKINI